MSEQLWRFLSLLAALCLVGGTVRAQELQEMEFEELPSTGLIVDDPEAAVLVVETTVTSLIFNSRGGIRQVREPEPGIYRVFLNPGVHYVEIRAKGYLLLKLPRWNFQPKTGRKIRVRPKPRFGPGAGFDANRPQLRLDYAPDSGQEVYVQLDDNPPQKLDFSRGYITLRPTPGAHTVQVYAGGRTWKRTFDLESGKSYRETVVMSAGTRSEFAAGHPGNLYVESEPPGAAVYLNQVEQPGVTPLSLNDLQPGIYQIEVVLAQHLPASQQVEVKELEYTNVSLELTPNYGQVEIGSTPSGALVYLSDEQRGITPFNVRLDAGVYPLRLVQSLYHEEFDTLRIEPGTKFSRTYPLRPRFGTVEVTSDPPGVRVEAEGVSWGVTPLTREQVLSGRHIVRVELEPYPSQERAVEVRDGQAHKLHFDLSSRIGHLTALSDPPGATVTLKENGRQLGSTPLRQVPLSPGTYTLVFALPDHDTTERTIPVAQGDAPQVEVALVRHVGHLRVETTPPRARIFLDGTARGETPQVIRDLPTGSYSMRIEKEGYDPETRQILIERDEVADQRITLGTAGTEAWKARRNHARKLAVFPGLGQFSSPGQAWRGLLYIAGIGASGYFAYDANTAYDQADQDYQEALQAYRSALDQESIDSHYRSTEQAVDEMDSASKQFTISIAAVGGLYALQWLDAWIAGGGSLQTVRQEDSPIAPFARLDPRKAHLGLAWRF